MNWFWKKHNTGEVINDFDYSNLAAERKQHFSKTQEAPTHQVEDEDEDGSPIFSTFVGLEIAESLLDSNSSNDSGSSSSDNSSSFGGFDGGSGGGGPGPG